MNFVLYKDQKWFESIFKSLDPELNLFNRNEIVDAFNSTSFNQPEIKEDYGDLSTFYSKNDIFWVINEKWNSIYNEWSSESNIIAVNKFLEKNNVLQDPRYIIWYIVNFLINLLIKYNSEQKTYFNEKDRKFIKLKTDSIKMVFFIKEIIRGFDDSRVKHKYNYNFEEWFDHFLLDWFFVEKCKSY